MAYLAADDPLVHDVVAAICRAAQKHVDDMNRNLATRIAERLGGK